MHTRQQAHTFQKGNPLPTLRHAALHFLPMRQHGVELGLIDFNPPSFQPHQTGTCRHHLGHFRLGQGFVSQRIRETKVEQRTHAKASGILPNVDLHLWPCRMARLPPVGNAHHNAAGLKMGNVLQKLVGVQRCPGAWLVNCARFEQSGKPGAVLRRFMHGQQKLQQGATVFAASVFLQGPPQGQVLHFGLLGNGAGIGG